MLVGGDHPPPAAGCRPAANPPANAQSAPICASWRWISLRVAALPQRLLRCCITENGQSTHETDSLNRCDQNMADLRMPALCVRLIADQRLAGMPAGGLRGVQLLVNIGQEQQFVGRDADSLRDVAVRRGFSRPAPTRRCQE